MKLTEWTSCGGCAAKWGASPLDALVKTLAGPVDEALLVGLAPFDDAAVYRVSDDLAVVATTDFFPPLVDELCTRQILVMQFIEGAKILRWREDKQPRECKLEQMSL